MNRTTADAPIPGGEAGEIIRELGLVPHGEEGGWYRETARSGLVVLTDSGSRAASTAIYYLLTDGVESVVHSVPGPEVWHFYAGSPVDLFIGTPDGGASVQRLGPDVLDGMRPQITVPGGCWQAARLVPGGAWALMGTTMTPGFDFADWRQGDIAALRPAWPEFDRWCTAAGGEPSD